MDERGNISRPAWTRPSMLDKDAETLAENLLEPATMRAVRDACRDLLGERPDAAAVRAAACRSIEIAEQVWGDLEAEGPRYECRKGCAWCCHQTVMVTAPEVFVVVARLHGTLPPDAIERLAERLEARSAAIVGKTTGERMHDSIACGLLEDGACSVHPVRPLPCRGGFSQDAGFCEALFGDPAGVAADVAAGRREGPFLVVPKVIFNSAQVGLVTALRELGYVCRPLELTAAMALALRHEDIVDAWLTDEAVFAAAELRRVDGHYVTNAVSSPP